jgi:DNA-binding response OmpR family regulator
MSYSNQISAIRQTLLELSQAQLRAGLCVSQLQELVAVDVGTEPSGAQAQPRADESKFCIEWRGRSCFLGHTKCFRLFVCLLRRTDRYVSYDHLLRDVWDGDVKSPATVRSGIRELKRRLTHARMEKLAGAIRGQGRHYGLILHARSEA